MIRIAIMASGSGSNAQKILEYFAQAPQAAEVSLILTNNPSAGVIERARRFHVPTLVFDKHTLVKSDRILNLLQHEGVDLIVLAGFMMLIPPSWVAAYPNRILNIHPALLPKFGGKGMYGHHVHEAVVAAGERESGITIHYVNERYDEGQIILQARCSVTDTDTPTDVAHKVQLLEHAHYPRVVAEVVAALSS
jgi:phosphoribosylglycinamide formyltransferase-1